MNGAEQKDPDGEPDEENESPPMSGGARSLLFWFLVILGINVVSMLWLAVRADSPAYIRNILDFFLYGVVGATTAYFAFRALFLFPFRMSDLFVIVMLLSLELKIAVDQVNQLSMLNLLGYEVGDPEHLGQIFQVCLLAASVAVGGAAFGLRHCQLLKIDGTFGRALTIMSGMLSLPAAAGIAAFLVLAVLSLSNGQTSEALVLMLLWFGSMAITGLNVAYFIRTVTLNAEIAAQEKMP